VVCHLIWIPGYERYAVTASADSPDMYGYCDFALGSFENGRPVIDAVGEIIKRDWAEQREDHGRDHRELFLGGGLIDRATAERWAAEVWPAGQRRAFI
jgi:hypothetical protein